MVKQINVKVAKIRDKIFCNIIFLYYFRMPVHQ